MNNNLRTSLFIFTVFFIVPVLASAQEPLLGFAEGTGTYLNVTDSDYLNVSLQSSQQITVLMESVPKTISILIRASTSTDFAILTLANLTPNAVYYKYTDSYHNEEIITADSAGKYVWAQDISSSHHIWFQKTKGTTYLPGDCNGDVGTWYSDTSTCVLKDNLTGSVQIDSDGLTLDCAGNSIIGQESGYGIYLDHRNGVTIRNCTSTNFSTGIGLINSGFTTTTDNSIYSNSGAGIGLAGSPNNVITENSIHDNATGISASWSWSGWALALSNYNKITGNDIHSNSSGISMAGSSYNKIEVNNISAQDGFGIYLTKVYYGSSHNEIFGNHIETNGLPGLMLGSNNSTVQNNFFENCGMLILEDSHGNTVSGNTVNSKPLVYLENASDATVNNAGQVILLNSSNITISGLDISHNSVGIEMYHTNNSTITDNAISSNSTPYGVIQYANAGIYLHESNNNAIINNDGINNNYLGIFLDSSDNNTVSDNSLEGSGGDGIIAVNSDDNAISSNIVSQGNEFGIYLNGNNNVLSGNTISGNDYVGIGIWAGSIDTLLDDNMITDNGTGIYLYHTFQTTVKDNGIQDNSTGLSLWNTTDSTIFHNNFKSNNQQTNIWLSQPYLPSTNFFYKELPDDGNYWSDYDAPLEGCSDSDNDSFCDAARLLPLGHQDRYPFVQEISPPLSTKAASLAKQLVNSAYLYGGKGWDYIDNEFVAADAIKTGYNYYNASTTSIDFGAGVDCSGLVMWTYDRSFDQLKSRFYNFVKAESTDEQYRYNTASTTEADLKPGDVMFFDFFPTSAPDGFIDHVAMYVGESDGYNVVNPANPDLGIRPASKTTLKQLSRFRGFKQVVSASHPAILVSAHSPTDLIVTDPDGFTITPETIIPSDLEFLRQIPGVLYYSEIEKGADGNPIDQVYSYDSKTGDYIIKVLPEPGVSPTSTYSLTFQSGDRVVLLAQNTLVSQAPSQGYGITVSATGTVSSFIPVAIDIKPGSFPNSINLKSKGTTPVAVLTDQSFNAKDIVVSSIIFAGAKPTKGNLEDIDKDGDLDLILHFDIQLLQLSPTSIEAVLTGQLADGNLIKGTDSVRIVQKIAEQTIFTKFLSYFNQFIQNLISVIGLAAITK